MPHHEKCTGLAQLETRPLLSALPPYSMPISSLANQTCSFQYSAKMQLSASNQGDSCRRFRSINISVFHIDIYVDICIYHADSSPLASLVPYACILLNLGPALRHNLEFCSMLIWSFVLEFSSMHRTSFGAHCSSPSSFTPLGVYPSHYPFRGHRSHLSPYPLRGFISPI